MAKLMRTGFCSGEVDASNTRFGNVRGGLYSVLPFRSFGGAGGEQLVLKPYLFIDVDVLWQSH